MSRHACKPAGASRGQPCGDPYSRASEAAPAHLWLGALGEAGAERAHDGGNIQAPAVLVPVHDHRRQQQDLAVAPLVIALLLIVRLQPFVLAV